MNSNYNTEQLKKHWLSQLNNYENEYRRANRRRNVAAFADFTKNLLSLVAQNGTIRYNVTGKPRAGAANKEYEEAQERYRKAYIDYEGKIAAMQLKQNSPTAAVKTIYNPLVGLSEKQLSNPFADKTAPAQAVSGFAPAHWASGLKPQNKISKIPYWHSNKKHTL